MASSRFAFGLKDSQLWGCGDNNYGQLGLLNIDKISEFTCIPFCEPIVDVAVGCEHSLLLTQSGKVFATGRGSKGQLGLGEGVQTLRQFTIVSLPTRVKHIYCGVWFSLALLDDGRVFGWGSNRGRCLLDDDESVLWEPVHLAHLQQVKKISAGHRHIVVLYNDGSVKSFGDDRFGQLAFDSGPVKDIFTGWNHTVLLRDSRQLQLFGTNTFNQLAHPDPSARGNIINFDSEITALAVGSDHVLCLVPDKGLFSFGWNEHGVLGDGTNQTIHGSIATTKFNVSRIRSIFCGYGSCFLIAANNKDDV